MFKRKGMVVVGCIIILLLFVIVGWVMEKTQKKSSGDGSVTFYDLIMDFDTSTLKFASYEPGDNVVVKDKISKMEIRENMSIDHNGKEYGYSANIWLDSMKKLIEYYEKPTLSFVGDHNRTTMQSNFQVGDEITIHFTVNSCKWDSITGDTITRSGAPKIKIINIRCKVNNNHTEVKEINLKAGLYAGSGSVDLKEVLIEFSWEDYETTIMKNGETTLINNNSSALYYDKLEFKEFRNRNGLHILKTIFDHIEISVFSDKDIFYSETLRDMRPCTMPEGIITSGDIINITLNLSHFTSPPTGGLNPGSYVEIKIIPRPGIPTYEEIHIPDVFPEDEKWIQL